MSETTLLFSENDLYPKCGRIPIKPKEWDYKLGELWTRIANKRYMYIMNIYHRFLPSQRFIR